MSEGFFEAVETAFLESDAGHKCQLVTRLPVLATDVSVNVRHVVEGNLTPGRPAAPKLVHPSEVPRRRLNTDEGRVALVHAVAHIEFNAINLALDAVWRFRGMPAQYYVDWIAVAVDEARHFGWLQARLKALCSQYGDCDAHNGLWEAAVKTAHDPLVRMALVPRVLEARGLDVTPGMVERLKSAGDEDTVCILEKILAEEVTHVETGSRWYHFLCDERGLDADSLFPQLLEEYMNTVPRGPFNLSARQAAGFTTQELGWLRSLSTA